MKTRRHPAFAVIGLLGLWGCADMGRYVWADQYEQRPLPGDKGYVIAPGDLISVRVFNQDSMSARGRVRSDGRFTLPFLNDVEVAGYTPTALALQLEARLRDYIKTPAVTVSLEEAGRIGVAILGEVGRQGAMQLEAGTGLLQALAAAGGLTELAHRDRIFVLRQGNSTTRIRFTFEAVSHAEGRSAAFRLRDGDVIVVE